MLTFLTGLLLTAVIVVALYAFGVFNTPYLDAFRVTFYLLLVLLILSVWFGTGNNNPNEGYDATVGAAR
jgi:predicted membrane channel-forming protein YqfA (hemolysin III family)